MKILFLVFTLYFVSAESKSKWEDNNKDGKFGCVIREGGGRKVLGKQGYLNNKKRRCGGKRYPGKSKWIDNNRDGKFGCARVHTSGRYEVITRRQGYQYNWRNACGGKRYPGKSRWIVKRNGEFRCSRVHRDRPSERLIRRRGPCGGKLRPKKAQKLCHKTDHPEVIEPVAPISI